MGQKTHPKAFRLVTTQKHLSEWYSNKLYYSKLIKEDYGIREKINTDFGQSLSISKVEINRINQGDSEKQYVNIVIHALFPRAKEMYRKVGKYFNENTENQNIKQSPLLNNLNGNLKKFTAVSTFNTA